MQSPMMRVIQMQECFLSATGMVKSMIVRSFSKLGQQIVDFVVRSIHWLQKSSCKNSCAIYLINLYSCIICILYNISKSSSGWTSGIENVYHDPCQDWMDLINMKLTSPNYPEPYNQQEHCVWNITIPKKYPKGYFVSLDFEKINVSIHV